MNFTKISITALSLLAFESAALARSVVIDDHRCVKTTIAHAHESITDYDSYSRIPGARYELKILGLGVIPLLTMVKSQSRYAIRTSAKTDGFVWVVLQPVNLRDANLYPKFLLHCQSEFDSATHFTHRCNLDKDKLHSGLRDFTSTLEVTEASPLCGDGATRLDYRLVLDSISDDVTSIKRAVTRPLGPGISDIVAALFDEEKFFRDYYKNFYGSWAHELAPDSSPVPADSATE